jgi:hypothetical protein
MFVPPRFETIIRGKCWKFITIHARATVQKETVGTLKSMYQTKY